MSPRTLSLMAVDQTDSPLVIHPGETGTIVHLMQTGKIERLRVERVDAEVLDLRANLRAYSAEWTGMNQNELELGWVCSSGDRLIVRGLNIGDRPTLFRVFVVFDEAKSIARRKISR